jgi:tetratricopeptide (TPR) repeat protein
MYPKEINILAKDQKSKLTALGIAVIIFIGVLLYSNTLHAPFIFDDYSSIVDNDAIKDFTISLKDISNNRYLLSLSFAINYAIGDLKPFGYHLINILIHIINAILVYHLVILTFRTPYFSSQQSPIHQFTDSPIRLFTPFRDESLTGFTYLPLFIAFSSAFIFIAHPIQTQAVTYIAQRAASMTAMFYLLSLVMYIKWRLRTQDAGLRMHRASWILYLCSLLFAIFAMKTKEIAFTLPVVITLYEFSFFNKSTDYKVSPSNSRRFLYLLPILLTLLVIPLSMLNFTAPVDKITQDINIQSRETVNITRTDYLLTQFRVILTYLRLLIMPVNQSLDYSSPVYHSFFDLQVFLSFLFLLSIFGIAVYLFYASRYNPPSPPLSKGGRGGFLRLISFGIFWLFITLSVESSFIPIRDVIVEHRLYLPSIGFFIAAVLSVDYLFSNMRLKTAVMAAIVLALSVGTYHRNIIWQNPQKLWEDVISKSPNNVRAYTELGAIFRDEGQYAEAMNQFDNALKINKNYALTYYNIGYIQFKLGNYKNALMYLRKTLEFNLPSLIRMETFNSLGMTYSEMGNDVDAINAFKEAIKTLPTSIIPYNNLGRHYIKMGNFDCAIEILKKGLGVREEPHLRSNLLIAYDMKAQTKNKD